MGETYSSVLDAPFSWRFDDKKLRKVWRVEELRTEKRREVAGNIQIVILS